MPLIILDRDGVINQDSANYIKCADEWQPIPGSIQAMVRLSQAGYQIGIATNQAGLGRGLFSETDLQQMHSKMRNLVEAAGGKIDCICYCPHHPDEGCDCRKPKPGLIKAIERQLQCSAQGAFFIGDSYKDIEAARSGGCRPILVKTGNGEQTAASGKDLSDVKQFNNLAQAVDWVLETNQVD